MQSTRDRSKPLFFLFQSVDSANQQQIILLKIGKNGNGDNDNETKRKIKMMKIVRIGGKIEKLNFPIQWKRQY